jgi:hypothetical protein
LRSLLTTHPRGFHKIRSVLIGVLLLLLVCCACLVAAIGVCRLWEATLSPQERELTALHETLVICSSLTSSGPTTRPGLFCLAATGNAADDLQLTHTEISARMEAKGYPESQIADFLRIVEITGPLPERELELLEQVLAEKLEELGDDD